ncbi:hypothetical protein ACQP2C_09750 [Micromonospora zamorensis]|uniref:hypothetical protein n=1 Tax=Micromonospora zamorensis TaxID=709883 RepID=UPI003D99B71E
MADHLDVPPRPAVAGLRGGAPHGVRGAAQGALRGQGELRRPQWSGVAGHGGEQRVADGGGVREQVEMTVRAAEHLEQRRPARRVVPADHEAAQRGEEQWRVAVSEQAGSAVFDCAPEVAGGPHVDRRPGGGQVHASRVVVVDQGGHAGSETLTGREAPGRAGRGCAVEGRRNSETSTRPGPWADSRA